MLNILSSRSANSQTTVPDPSITSAEVALREAQREAEEIALHENLLVGAKAIADELFGNARPATVRKVYRLIETSSIPVIRLGGSVALRRSVLRKWIEAQELRSVGLGGAR